MTSLYGCPSTLFCSTNLGKPLTKPVWYEWMLSVQSTIIIRIHEKSRQALTIFDINSVEVRIHCWDYPDDSLVLPISRYRRSKATLLLPSTGGQLTYDLLWTVGVTSIFTNRYLLQSNYKTWGKASQTRTSYKQVSSPRISYLYQLPAGYWGKAPIRRPARSAIKAPTQAQDCHWLD